MKTSIKLVTLSVVLVLAAACQKPSSVADSATTEALTLASSVFNQGEAAPDAEDFLQERGLAMLDTGTDGGFIPGGSTNPGGGDGGSIPAPGSGGTTTPPASGGSSGGTTTPTTPGGSSSGGTVNNGGSSSGGTTTPTTPPASGGTDGGTANNGGTTQPGTNDGGTIPGGSANNGNDGGSTTPPANGGTTPGTDGGGGGTVNPGGGVADNGGNTPGGNSSGGTDNGGATPGGSNGGNDGGGIADNGSSNGGADGGSTQPGGGTIPGGNDGGSSHPGGGVADNGGNSNPGGGTTPGGNDGGGSTTPSTPGGGVADNGNSGGGTTPGNDGGVVPGGNSGGGSTDGGTTNPSNPGGGVADNGGNSNPGGGNTTPDNGGGTTTPSNPGGGVADNGNSGGNTTPGTDGGSTPGGNTPGGNGDGGTTPGGDVADNDDPTNPSTPDNDGGDDDCKPGQQDGCSCQPKKFKVVISRVCSVRRSQSDNLFFEEAKHPILSFEASWGTKESERKYQSRLRNLFASVGFGVPRVQSKMVQTAQGKLRYLVASFDLSKVNLLKGKYTQQLDLALNALKDEFSSQWKKSTINVAVCDDKDRDGYCSDEKDKNQLAVEIPKFKAKAIPSTIQIDVWNGRYLTKGDNPDKCEMQYSPLVLDLQGNGIQLAGPEAGAQFDLNDTGEEVRTGWVAGRDDALLARDLNKNGKIDSGAELFGSATKLSSGVRAANGFEALKELDTDLDGAITPKDKAWKELVLWLDMNHDGRTDKNELISLDTARLSAIKLNYVNMLEVDKFGNETRQRSVYTRKINGKDRTLLVVDVWFTTLVEN